MLPFHLDLDCLLVCLIVEFETMLYYHLSTCNYRCNTSRLQTIYTSYLVTINTVTNVALCFVFLLTCSLVWTFKVLTLCFVCKLLGGSIRFLFALLLCLSSCFCVVSKGMFLTLSACTYRLIIYQ